MPERTYHIVLNARSGTAQAAGITPEVIEQAFALRNLKFTLDSNVEMPLSERVAMACSSGADVVVAAGGDGTVTAIAQGLLDSKQMLAILPLGTVNMLARDLGLPLDLEPWMDQLSGFEPRRIDVGQVNGRAFLHKVVIGFIPGVAKAREHIRGRSEIWAKLGFLRFFLRRLVRARRISVEIAFGSGHKTVERVAAVAVANNDYAEGLGRFFSRQQFDGNRLCLYLLRRLTLGDFARLFAEMGLGRWRHDPALDIRRIQQVTIRTRKPQIKAMIDGEVETLSVPLEFGIRPGALSILAPPEAREAPPAAAALAEA